MSWLEKELLINGRGTDIHALLMDAQIMLRTEEFASNMGQRRSNVVLQDVQIKP